MPRGSGVALATTVPAAYLRHKHPHVHAVDIERRVDVPARPVPPRCGPVPPHRGRVPPCRGRVPPCRGPVPPRCGPVPPHRAAARARRRAKVARTASTTPVVAPLGCAAETRSTCSQSRVRHGMAWRGVNVPNATDSATLRATYNNTHCVTASENRPFGSSPTLAPGADGVICSLRWRRGRQ